MKRIITVVCLAVFMLAVNYVAVAAELRTKAEAVALVKKAVAYINANGKEEAFAEISNPNGQFVDRELYIFVYDLNGQCMAHGLNQKMIGKVLIDLTDPDGKKFNKELIEVAKSKGKGWVDFKFTNPLTKKIQDKTGYVELCQDVVIGSGIYR